MSECTVVRFEPVGCCKHLVVGFNGDVAAKIANEISRIVFLHFIQKMNFLDNKNKMKCYLSSPTTN